jgi:S-adenosylmethionine synthetase
LDLIVRNVTEAGPSAREVEVVERKGIGHPDTICDGIAEQISVDLCKQYRERFGTILHHNVDKVLLCGGAARAEFGGGDVIEPIEIYLAGRATASYRGETIDIHEIATRAARDWLRRHVRGLDLDRGVRVISRLRAGSADLTALFARRGASTTPLANDTSCGVGFAPLTDLERVVLNVERALNSAEAKRIHPEIGEDVKVMGVRRGSAISLTIGCAIVARFVRDLDAYIRGKDAVRTLALGAARSLTKLNVEAIVNAADDPERSELFLTVTGTSAEAGDDGEVGRGNRTSGLITPYRPMTLEAAAGKNPVSHVGKLYNLVAGRIASRVATAPGADAACLLVSRIGHPIDEPDIVDVCIGGNASGIADRARIEEIVRAELAHVADLQDELMRGAVTLF